MSAHIICKGSTKKGKPCTNRASVGPNSHFCRLHNPEGRGPAPGKKQQRCGGTTRKRKPCNSYAQPGKEFCKIHEAPPRPPPPPKPNCQSKTARGQQCRKKAINGTKYCNFHTDPYSYSYSSNYSNYNWYDFFGKTYTPPPQPPPVRPDKIKEALNFFNLPENTNYNDIKKKYREFALKHHPDKGGEIALFQKIQEYYSVLGEKYK